MQKDFFCLPVIGLFQTLPAIVPKGYIGDLFRSLPLSSTVVLPITKLRTR